MSRIFKQCLGQLIVALSGKSTIDQTRKKVIKNLIQLANTVAANLISKIKEKHLSGYDTGTCISKKK